MGCNLLRHACNHFITHEAQHHDTQIFNHHFDIIIAISICIIDPYSVFMLCMRTHIHAYVCVDTSVYTCIYSRVQKKVNVAYRNYYVITDRSTNC